MGWIVIGVVAVICFGVWVWRVMRRMGGWW